MIYRIVHEVRQNCPAPAHDTRHAWEAYGCKCPKARLDMQRHDIEENRKRGLRHGTYSITHEERPGCPATAHDTRRAYSVYGCRCPKALEVVRAARAADRESAKAKKGPAAPRPRKPPSSGAPDYDQTEARADWVMVERLVKQGPQPGAIRYDKWMAVGILTDKGELSSGQIGYRVGLNQRSVQRYQKWMRENAKAGKEDTK